MRHIMIKHFKFVAVSKWARSLTLTFPLWGLMLFFSSCEEAISIPAENCKDIIKETVSLFEIKAMGHAIDQRTEKEKYSLGSIRYDLLSLFVLVHSRQDLISEQSDSREISKDNGKQLLSEEQNQGAK